MDVSNCVCMDRIEHAIYTIKFLNGRHIGDRITSFVELSWRLPSKSPLQ